MIHPLLPIFSSATRLKLLQYFVSYPDKKLYFQEIIRELDLENRNTFLELNKLEKLGILESTKVGRLKYYWVNQKSPYFGGFQLLLAPNLNTDSDKISLTLVASSIGGYPQLLTAASQVEPVNNLFGQFDLANKLSLIIHHYQNQSYNVYLKTLELEKIAEEMTAKFLANDDYLDNFQLEFEARKSELLEVLADIPVDLSSLDNLELSQLYETVYHKYTQFSLLQWLVFVFETYNVNYQNLEKEVIGEDDFTHSTTQLYYQETLADSTELEVLESQDYLAILKSIKQDLELKNYLASNDVSILKSGLKLNFPDFFGELKKQAKTYHHLSYRYNGKGWNLDYYLNLVRNFATNYDLLRSFVGVTLGKPQPIKQINPSTLQKVQKLNTLLSQRRFVFYEFFAKTNGLYLEIAKRLGISSNQVKYLYPAEIRQFLETVDQKNLSANLASLNLHSRQVFGLEVSDLKQNLTILTDKPAQKYFQQFKILGESNFANKVFRGEILWGGQAVAMLSDKIEANTFYLVQNLADLNLKKLLQTRISGLIVHNFVQPFLLTNIARIKQIPCIYNLNNPEKLELNQLYFLDGSHGKMVKLD